MYTRFDEMKGTAINPVRRVPRCYDSIRSIAKIEFPVIDLDIVIFDFTGHTMTPSRKFGLSTDTEPCIRKSGYGRDGYVHGQIEYAVCYRISTVGMLAQPFLPESVSVPVEPDMQIRLGQRRMYIQRQDGPMSWYEYGNEHTILVVVVVRIIAQGIE